jgi:serine phosphatase RsbU (regulator of sigma subunit)
MKIISISILFWSIIVCVYAQKSPFVIDNIHQEEQMLQAHLAYWISSADTLSEAIKNESKFMPLEVTKFPAKPVSFWLKFTIENKLNRILPALLNLGYFERVTLYQLDTNNQIVKQNTTGMSVPLSQRGIQIDSRMLERMRLPVGKTTVLLHITYQNALHYSNLAYTLKRISIREEVKNFELQYFNHQDRIVSLLFLGAVFLMFFYNVAIFMVLLDRNYLFYVLYLFFAGAYFFINKGLYVEWIAPEQPENKLLWQYITIHGCMMFRLLFTKSFLELKKRLRWANNLVWSIVGLTCCIWLVMLLGQYSILRNFTAFCMIVSVVSMWLLGFVPAVKQHKPTYFYLLGNVGLIIGATTFSLLTMHVLPSNVYTENAGVLGILFEMSLFSLGLANKINEAKKELAQQTLVAERREKILIEAKNRELEEKVIERTQDLKNANEELVQTLDTVELQRNQIEHKNQSLVASINYARRIQTATLPKQDNMSKYLGKMFVFYQPRDIVSGDFYWFTSVEDRLFATTDREAQEMAKHSASAPFGQQFYTLSTTLPTLTNEKIALSDNEVQFLAVADCTGHGVPGAFMTILGKTLLDQIINRDKIYSPAQILTELDTRLLKILQQQDGADSKINDGMDIMLMRFDVERKTVCWAGSKHSIWVYETGSVEIEPTIYKGDKYPIGSTHAKEEKAFTEQTLYLKAGDMLYTFTDGYADQFNGRDKFTTKRLKQLLYESSQIADMEAQKEKIAQTFYSWKGETHQTDDVLVVGLRVLYTI